MFGSCAAALFSVITDLESIEKSVERRVDLRAEELDALLYDWLAELVYLKDVHRELYCEFRIELQQHDGFHLVAAVGGELIDPLRHHTRTDVKAVTYHRLEIKKTDSGYEAFVVLDL